jgi:ketosteroid isomerase-like protein
MANNIGKLAYDLEHLGRIFSDDVSLNYPGLRPMVGKRMSLTFLRRLFSQFAYLHFTQTDIIVDENRACIVWENKGCRNNGNPYNNKGVTLVEAADNKIYFLSDYFKFQVTN